MITSYDLRNGNVIAVPDLHAPYHNRRAWDLMLEIVAYTKPDKTVCLGDFGDNRPFSRHKKKFGEHVNDPEKDMQLVAAEAKRLEQAAGADDLIFLLGNHDEWYTRYVAENAPNLEKFVKSPGQVYQLRHEPVPYQQTVRIGKVGYVHDLGPYGVNAVRATLDVAGHNVVFGHCHRGGVAYKGNDAGERHFGMACGWVGDRDQITYMTRAATKDWQMGFGGVSYSDGLAFAHFVPFIERGKKLTCLYRGKRFTG